jgi:hypothetical protein
MPIFDHAESDSSELLQYLALERVSPQWSAFLTLLGGELSSQLSSEELRQLLLSLGGRFAEANPLGSCVDVASLQDSVNRIWAAMQWGYCKVSDQGAQLSVTHRACPLPAALQLDADVAGWYLEGVYGVWLRAAGAPSELVLRQEPSSGIPMCMTFTLTAAAVC